MAELGQSSSGVVATLGRPLSLAGCGALSGIITKTGVAPLERVKLLYQVQGLYGTTQYTSVGQSLRKILAEDGARGFYYGNGANIARILPAYSLKFMFNDTYKTAFLREGQQVSQMGFGQLLGAGMLAGFSQATITYPLETIRTRLSLDSAMGRQTGIMDCAIRTIRKEGVRALYSGYIVTFLSTPLYVGLQMSLYDVFKRKLPKDPETGRSSPMYSMLAGACAGLIAQTSAYWGDTIKKQMQANGVNGEKKYSGFVDCVTKIYRSGGLRSFYPGIALNSIKCIPEAGIQFAVYDFCKATAGLE